MSDYYNNDTMELVIKPGDDISVIASAFGLTPEAIIAQNAGSWPPTPGQALQIPIPPQRCPSGTSYIIRQGDTLASIARRFSTTQAALLRENPFLVLLGPRPGLRICIPVVPSCPSSNLYTVRFGDTLPRIAQRFNTTVREILQANPGLDPDRLVPGQQICIPAQRPPACSGTVYTVMAGDTLFTIALRFGTTVDAILQANPGLDPLRLFVDQQICIPAAPPPVCPGFIYTVVAGDTLNQIAFRFNTTVQAILRANPGLDPNFIVIGQRICIPTTPPGPTPPCIGFIYTVTAGDTLFAIASRFNVTVEAILRVNPGLDPNFIQIDQQICIPR